MGEREMTPEEAAEVLNRHRHRGHARWAACPPGEFVAPDDGDRYEYLEDFEAIAVAEKYLKIEAAGEGA